MTDAGFCQQRAIRQMYNAPLTRFNIDSINPYLSGKYTKSQLDMRRKVEILKYNSNKVSGQTNSLTKKQKFSLLVRGGFKSPSQIVLNGGVLDCSADNYIPTPTSSCDVPGPVSYLQEDPSIPLYNYSNFNIRSYPDYIPPNNNFWNFVVLSDANIYSKETQQDSDTAYYLIINNLIDETKYTYNLIVPLGITFSGIASYQNLNTPVSVSMTSATLNVYFNNNLAKQLTSTTGLPNFAITPTLSMFSASQLFGTLYFTGLQLYTAPTYVYTFSLQIELSLNTSIVGFEYTIIANPTLTANTASANGCTITNFSLYNPVASITPV